MIRHHDPDPVYSGYEWTSRLPPKDDLEMEAFNGRLNTEGHSLFLQALSSTDLITVVGERMRCYNTEQCYPSIGCVPLLTCIKRCRQDVEE